MSQADVNVRCIIIPYFCFSENTTLMHWGLDAEDLFEVSNSLTPPRADFKAINSTSLNDT